MSLVTSRLHVTLPKLPLKVSTKGCLELFDDASQRQREREAAAPRGAEAHEADRGWTREEIYDRGRAR